MATTLIAKIAARAKQLRAKSPSMTWQAAIKKAGAEYRGTTVKTTSKRRTTTAKKKTTTKKRSKVGDPIYNAYKRAPLAVKKILDQLGDEPDYKDLHWAAAALKKKGWFMDYGLDAQITALRPIKKTTTKKVGVVAKTKKGAPRKRLSKSQREYNEMADQYKYFVVDLKTGRVSSGWEYKEDAKDALSDFDKGDAKIYTLSQLKREGVADPRSEWKYKLSGTHKDTKSHNANIRVVSGTKKPKIEKAAVNMDALNGVIKYQTGKYYEVIKGDQKGSVIKITSIRKPTSAKEGSMLHKTYNVDFYEFRNGHLQKPFLGVITDRWLNKRSVRPRPTVKSHELKKFI